MKFKKIIDVDISTLDLEKKEFTLSDIFLAMGTGEYYLLTPVFVSDTGTVVFGNQSIQKKEL